MKSETVIALAVVGVGAVIALHFSHASTPPPAAPNAAANAAAAKSAAGGNSDGLWIAAIQGLSTVAKSLIDNSDSFSDNGSG